MYNKFKSGFTLVELSIVLVIIGLIVGGILVGQDMINAAKSRATVAQIEKYSSAMNTFKEKYNAVPGDYNKAVVSLGAAGNGNGNGAITNNPLLAGETPPVAGGFTDVEYGYLFNHLSLAKMIDGNFDGTSAAVNPGTNFPKPKTGVGAFFGFTDLDGRNYWYIGLNTSAAAAPNTDDILRPDEALSIDAKLDDGKPNTGIVLANDNYVLRTAADNCVTGTATTSDYKLVEPLALACQLRLRMSS